MTTGKLVQTGEVLSGGSYLSQSDLRLHFGLGAAMEVDKLEVMWTHGPVQTFTHVRADHFYRLKQQQKLEMIEIIKGGSK